MSIRYFLRAILFVVAGASAGLSLPASTEAVDTSIIQLSEPGGASGPYIQFSDAANNVKPYGYFKADAKWASEANGQTVIFVCWENPSPGFSREMAMVKDSIVATWQKYSRIEFRGWGQCSADNAGIHIQIRDVGAYTQYLGKAIDRLRNGVVLNFTFGNWKGNEVCRPPGDFRDKCIQFVAIHEFGHAIGFAHEQNRPDTPGECSAVQGPQGPNGTVMLTPWDPESVMNYCNNANYPNAGKLSALDVVSLQKIYGAPQ